MVIGTVDIIGVIGDISNDPYFEEGTRFTTFLDVVRQVEAQKDAEKFLISIDSPGGLVEDGDEIFDYLKSLQVPLKTYARNVCASMATKLFMVGQERVIYEGCEFMIHNPWGNTTGDASQIENYASELRRMEKKFIDFYSEYTGTSKEAIKPLMNKESVLTAQQAVDLGFATEIFNNELKAVAILKKNTMSDNAITKEEAKSLLDSFGEKLKNFFNPEKPKMLVVQDVNGVEIDFPDVAEGETPAIGDSATVDGSPADGEYTTPDGKVHVFEGGSLSEVREPEGEEDDEMAQLKEENENLKEQLASVNAKAEESENEIQNYKSKFEELETEYEKIKNLAGSFKMDTTGKDTREKKGDKPQKRHL